MGRLFAAAILMAAFFGWTQTIQASPLVATVSIGEQKMTVTRYGKVVEEWRVSTAGSGYVTPRGEWRPVRMHKMWHSRKYEMAPMPYSIFYHGGYAIHGTNAISRLGRPASHGCVRLHPDNARKLFALVREVGPGNTRVVVMD